MGGITDYVKDIVLGVNQDVDANNWRADKCNYIFPENYNGNALNLPAWAKSGGGKLECKTWGSYSTQIFYPYGSAQNVMYMRSCHYNNGFVWTNWDLIGTIQNPINFAQYEVNSRYWSLPLSSLPYVRDGDIITISLGTDYNQTRVVVLSYVNIYGVDHFTVINKDPNISLAITETSLDFSDSNGWMFYLCRVYTNRV